MILRPYQEQLISDLRQAYREGARAPIGVLSTGGGKSICISAIAAGMYSKGTKPLIVAHRTELVAQLSRAVAAAGLPHRIIAPDTTIRALALPHRPLAQAAVASVQTLRARGYDCGFSPDLVIGDEVHHFLPENQWGGVFAAHPNARRLGFTATPARADGRGLGVNAGGVFDRLVMGPSAAWLRDNGYLAPATIYTLRSKVAAIESGDNAALSKRGRRAADPVGAWKQYAQGRRTIAFCVHTGHAKALASEFRDAGVAAEVIHGGQSAEERHRLIRALTDGSLSVLTSCDVVSEGTDIPAADCAMLLRATESLVWHLQACGRVLRTAPGKTDGLILDFVGNTIRLGLPYTEVPWSIDDGEPARGGRAARSAQLTPATCCEACFATFQPTTSPPRCPQCGHTRALRAIGEAGKGEGLALLEGSHIARLTSAEVTEAIRSIRTRADAIKIARARGYRAGWVDAETKRRGIIE